MKKILLLCNESSTVKNFRIELIKKFQKEGYCVGVCAFDDTYKDLIKALDVDFFSINGSNRSLNLFEFLKQSKSYKKLIKEYKPDIVFTFMLKPNTIGVQAAYKSGVKNIYSMVEGAGDVFINNSLKWKIIRKIVCLLYKKAFKYSKKVLFLNADDKQEFIDRKLVKEKQCEIIHGIGVDLEHFSYKPIKNYKTFLMVARMLKTKGIFEYCKCARIVKQKYPEAQFNYLGGEGTVTLSDIQEYIDDGSINYLGTTTDVRPYLENALLLLLSSYREGLPMSIMEAESVGRAIITSNGVGCKDTVIDGYNGFICEKGDYHTMAEKVIWCIEHPQEVELMGKNARKFAEDNFDSEKINNSIYDIISQNNH